MNTPEAKAVRVLGLDEGVLQVEWVLRVEPVIPQMDLNALLKSGMSSSAHDATMCLCWIWRQWLSGAPRAKLSASVDPFIARKLELRERCRCYDGVPLFDMLILACAIMAASDTQLKLVANRVADLSGDKGEKPLNNGELYSAAWCGMLKHWILGDDQKAMEQSEQIWGAYRPPGLFAASKPLALPWLRRDWTRFRKQQEKDFTKLWERARKDHWTIRQESATEIVVTTDGFQVRHQWCWAHCAMAVLAHRQGAEVASDPFWFPAVAIK
jgi:hypothetical protein